MSILLLFKVLLPFNKIIHYVLYNFEIILCMLEFLPCVHIYVLFKLTHFIFRIHVSERGTVIFLCPLDRRGILFLAYKGAYCFCPVCHSVIL